jgi:hypothetical protein
MHALQTEVLKYSELLMGLNKVLAELDWFVYSL